MIGLGNINASRDKAFGAIFGAFDWLIRNGLENHSIEWLGGFPLLKIVSPLDAFLTLTFLNDPRVVTYDPVTNETLYDRLDTLPNLVEGEQFFAFSYLDSPVDTPHYERGYLIPQENEIKKLFFQKYGADGKNLRIVRAHNFVGSNRSIKESITNLIAARYFIRKGYAVAGDSGVGPDVVAFHCDFVKELEKEGLLAVGSSVYDLALLRRYGGRKNRGDVEQFSYKSERPEMELIAIESESVRPSSGTNQIRGGYSGNEIRSVDFFNSVILAAPFLDDGFADYNVLTYDESGMKFIGVDKMERNFENRDMDRSKFVEKLEKIANRMLQVNLTVQEQLEMLPPEPMTLFQFLERKDALPLSLVISKVLEVIQMQK